LSAFAGFAGFNGAASTFFAGMEDPNSVSEAVEVTR
jgi:hypothetical protein